MHVIVRQYLSYAHKRLIDIFLVEIVVKFQTRVKIFKLSECFPRYTYRISWMHVLAWNEARHFLFTRKSFAPFGEITDNSSDPIHVLANNPNNQQLQQDEILKWFNLSESPLC